MVRGVTLEIQDYQIRDARLISFAAERIGFMLPEQVIVGGGLIFFIVTGVLAYPCHPFFRNTVQCVFVFSAFGRLLPVFTITHRGNSFRFCPVRRNAAVLHSGFPKDGILCKKEG